ncbi:hypothetical protein [Melittangium boletus]|uniref:STAS/SEC14 domain-containing protein n=1 Tax=Melittangium boletus DSM 14713 TaxID=1294270 RepID=A0A250IIM0_9BACT|nr:hypothetical protein [Melittangium boletus]ATB31118.1 hypothetical protein MEBOL_004580 [Melittangium boletus DSM 14713]
MPPPDPDLFDDSRWPLLLLRLPGTLSTPAYEACLASFSRHLERGERFVLITDLRRVGMVPLDQRWRQVEWFEEHERQVRECIIGAANIITSPLVRLSVSAIMYFKRVPLPLVTVADWNAAEAWALERLEEDRRARAHKPR